MALGLPKACRMGKEEMEVGSMMGLREGRQEREDAVDRLDEGIARAVGAEAGASVAEVEAGVEAGVGGADQGAGAGAGDGDDRGRIEASIGQA